ncbi:MAG: TonB-dependent receptor [Cytophagaceae bacterium]|nr:TonB-dependent receptor [Cytophagaceae bacterium]
MRHLIFIWSLLGFSLAAQQGVIRFQVELPERDSAQKFSLVVHVQPGNLRQEFTSPEVTLSPLPYGTYQLVLQVEGYRRKKVKVELLSSEKNLGSVSMSVMQTATITVRGSRQRDAHLKSVEGVAIYEAKKTELIELKEINANTATNNSRQIFSRVPGLNIWESDAAGLQLGIAARGLDPNRASNFNIRQNGYDLSADALGYPDSYYNPPSDAVERIEVVRGAASLQYGPQFGGMVNYVLKKGDRTKPLSLYNKNTLGSYGLFSTFTSLGGQVKKINYYTFYQYKTGRGWRPNTALNNHSAYAGLQWELSTKLTLKADLTLSYYLNQQPGGLTDAQFNRDASISVRERNWFLVHWRIASTSLDYKPTDQTRINIRTWGFLGDRKALGMLGNINRTDNDSIPRDLIVDFYKNIGTEARILHKYRIKKRTQVWLVGLRYYHGNSRKIQGEGPVGRKAEFQFKDIQNVEGSDMRFPGRNLALFSEHIFHVSPRWAITPGLRWEYLKTSSDGYYKQTFLNITDTLRKEDQRTFQRNFLIAGMGLRYSITDSLEAYGNASQNYRGITFTDMRVVRVAALVDPDLEDERGYNIDLGVRGKPFRFLTIDYSVFYLAYNNRIGQINYVDPDYNIYRLTTNIGATESKGLETFTELDISKLVKLPARMGCWKLFSTVGYVQALYKKSEIKTVVGNQVEFAPQWILRSGFTWSKKGFSTTLQHSYVSEQFTDATNSLFTGNAVNGLIPAYTVWDWSWKWEANRWNASGGINNIFNSIYFTRRAVSYPGPGIIPSEPRILYLSLGFKW